MQSRTRFQLLHKSVTRLVNYELFDNLYSILIILDFLRNQGCLHFLLRHFGHCVTDWTTNNYNTHIAQYLKK